MYNYEDEKKNIFSEKGQIMFLDIFENAKILINKSGAARLQEIIKVQSGDSWTMLACVDRLVELGKLREIPQDSCPAQYRVFVAGLAF